MLNVGAINGRLTNNPELKKTPNGISTCSFTVAVDRNYVKQGEERQADFIDCVAWKQQAEFLCKYFRKGSMVAVNGPIQTRNWEDKNGNKRKSTEIIADNINFGSAKDYPAPDVEVTKSTSYSYGNEGTFQEIPDDDDRGMPF